MTAKAIIAALNALQALFGFISSRGLERERVMALLDLAATEERDLTEAEVQAELNAVGVELDDTADLIDRD